MNKIEHIFFDLDHTLWDFDKNSALTFEKIFKLNKLELQIEKFLPIYEPINLNYWKLYREERIDKANLRYKRLKDAFDALEFQVEDEIIDKLAIDYIEYLTTFNHLFEGAVEVLEYLQENYQLHIITNGFEEAQLRKMTNAQITSYFKTITNSEMVGVKKPNPLIFNYALEKAEATPHNSIMIGDNLEADIEGAQNVGMSVLFFNYHNVDHPEDIKSIKSLQEIKQHL